MFNTEKDKMNKILICKKCLNSFDIPFMLPCGATLCSICELSVTYDAKHSQYVCPVCSHIHLLVNEQLPISETLQAILDLQPNEIALTAQLLADHLKNIQQKIESLKTDCIENGLNRIKEQCFNLKTQLRLTTESVLEQINDLNKSFIAKISDYEIECIDWFENDKNNLKKKINELELFEHKWTSYLKQTPSLMNDLVLNEGIKQTIELSQQNELLLNSKLNIDKLVFNGKILEFRKNEHKINSDTLGQLLFTLFN